MICLLLAEGNVHFTSVLHIFTDSEKGYITPKSELSVAASDRGVNYIID